MRTSLEEPMVELKILKKSEVVAERLQGREAIAEDVFEVPPRKAVKLIEEGVARTASWSDFEEDAPSRVGSNYT